MGVLTEMADSYSKRLQQIFPHDVEHCGLVIPLKPRKRVLAYDGNGQLWAFELTPLWSPAATKWIPQNADMPRLILTRPAEDVNSFLSIETFVFD